MKNQSQVIQFNNALALGSNPLVAAPGIWAAIVNDASMGVFETADTFLTIWVTNSDMRKQILTAVHEQRYHARIDAETETVYLQW